MKEEDVWEYKEFDLEDTEDFFGVKVSRRIIAAESKLNNGSLIILTKDLRVVSICEHIPN